MDEKIVLILNEMSEYFSIAQMKKLVLFMNVINIIAPHCCNGGLIYILRDFQP